MLSLGCPRLGSSSEVHRTAQARSLASTAAEGSSCGNIKLWHIRQAAGARPRRVAAVVPALGGGGR
eukprot:scaffold107292_cov30-Phaeocystis_antarctica.AAC.2